MSELLKGLPRKVRIGQFTLRFKVATTDERPELVNCNGLTLFEESLILLEAKHVETASAEQLLNTVQHEISHTINIVYGVDDESTEETFVAQHTNGLVAFWIDNPRFETWRRKMLREIKTARAKED